MEEKKETQIIKEESGQSEINREENLKKQIILYFTFAVCMIVLNYAIQKINELFISVWICNNYGDINLIQQFYCAIKPYDMRELVGSIAAVAVTYIVKFTLDKFIVFEKKSIELKETSQEFFKYFGFAILTTIENIGIQFLLTNFLHTPIEVSVFVALAIGYSTKFILDRKYVFS
ncbi:MAG: GtrA family protein [Promethearchaeia archaeon]